MTLNTPFRGPLLGGPLLNAYHMDATNIEQRLPVGQKVTAAITKNGYFQTAYKGVVTGYTKNGRIKVKSWRGVKCHARENVNIRHS